MRTSCRALTRDATESRLTLQGIVVDGTGQDRPTFDVAATDQPSPVIVMPSRGGLVTPDRERGPDRPGECPVAVHPETPE